MSPGFASNTLNIQTIKAQPFALILGIFEGLIGKEMLRNCIHYYYKSLLSIAHN